MLGTSQVEVGTRLFILRLIHVYLFIVLSYRPFVDVNTYLLYEAHTVSSISNNSKIDARIAGSSLAS